jgi:type I restriction enzyme R subunit
MKAKEAKARIKINKLLEEAGWRFLDDENGRANIELEKGVKLTEKDINNLGDNFEKTRNGYLDYTLLDRKGFPLVVLEAKREDKDPMDGKEQARKYAKSLDVNFIILSNGNLHYFWDLRKGNPNVIRSFPTEESLGYYSRSTPNPKNLVEEVITKEYIIETQYPLFRTDPDYLDEAKHSVFFEKHSEFRLLRDYQINALKSIQEAVNNGSDRFLFEMATGTGKTLTSAALIKLFLKTGNASRVLFLVDRLELEKQAQTNFVNYLKNDYTSVVFKENKDDWNKARIVVTTVQSLLYNDKYKRLFSPTDFDLLISDEAHRSINGNARALFEYFCGYKLGLTATPKDYLKNVNTGDLLENDARSLEKRLLFDTYKTFGCESGNPTFRYSLLDGVKDGFLINPIVIDARTNITTKLLSDEGYAVMVKDDDGDSQEKFFSQKDYEKKFFSDKTNYAFCKSFIENAMKDPITGEIGKSILFCVSQNHCAKIVKTLNEMIDKVYPNKYNSDFAVQVTSRIPNSQQMTINFTNNNLNGKTKFIDGYKSAKTRVCVTVGMMTTGYDCPDLLNVALMRPIFSPSDFIQIKGRGTRKNTFKIEIRENGETQKYTKEKQNFKLFDYFANCEYFEEKFDYDQVIELPKESSSPKSGGGVAEPNGDYESKIFDPITSIKETEIGLEGMKIDRKLYEKFEENVRENEDIQEMYAEEDFKAIEDYVIENIFDKPNDYINLEKLRKSIKIDRRVSLKEILYKIFGKITRFKNKHELLDDEFEKFVSIYQPENKYIPVTKKFFKAYITDDEIRSIIKAKEFAKFATNPKITMDDLKSLNGFRTIIPEYVKDYVNINPFM